MHVIQHYEHCDGFRATVCAWKGGRDGFPRSPIDSPLFPMSESAEQWCVAILQANHTRMGPLTIAVIERYSGPVSVMGVCTPVNSRFRSSLASAW
jgi:hypothetical protein